MKNNTGINILKIILPIAVICDHISGSDPILVYFQGTLGIWAVPCFMFLSFYLIADKLNNITGTYVLKRVKRLYIPLLFWSVIIFLIKVSLFGPNDNMWKSLAIQLLTGWDPWLAPQMWFNINQIILFLIMSFLFFLVKKRTVVVSVVLLIVFFVIEYSGVVTAFFVDKVDAIKYPIGRIVEMFPFAISGYCYGYISDKLKKRWINSILLLYLLLACIFGCVGNGIAEGLSYGGLKTYFVSVTISMFFVSIQVDNSSRVIDSLAGYGAGIYYIHYTIGQLIYRFATQERGSFELDTFVLAVLMYGISLLVLIPFKMISKNVKCLSSLV